MDIALQLPPEDIDTIATILARGYLRCRDAGLDQPEQCLDKPPDSSRHVSAVNTAENDDEAVIATEEEDR